MAAEASTVVPSERVAENAPASPPKFCTVQPARTSTAAALSTRSTMPPMASFAHSPVGTSLA